jgi:hypothetical protein
MTDEEFARAVVADRLQLLTYAELRVTPEGWWRDPATLQTVIGALATTERWRELEVLGVNYQPGAPLGSPADVARAIAAGGPGLYNLARGGPRQAMFSDQTSAWMQIGVGREVLKVISRVGGDVLARLGPAAIDDLVDAVAEIRAALDGRAQVLEMHVRPTALGKLSYPRPLPHRRAAIPLSAVVDVVESDPPADRPDRGPARAARAIARAEVPPGGSRVTLGNLLIIRWVDDPSDPVAVCKAAAAHEAWLAPLIETTPEQRKTTR